jgi:hypothetical protein
VQRPDAGRVARATRFFRASGAAIALVVLVGATSSGAALQTCSEFPNQAAAQRAADTRDGNGNGIYCESLPCPCSTQKTASKGSEGAGGSSGCVRPSSVQNIPFSKTKYPHLAAHVQHAIDEGWPSILVLNRTGASQRRDRLLADIPTKAGDDRDEYPPAEARGVGPGLTKGSNPTGWMADVEYVPSSENRSQGAEMEFETERFCNGTRFREVFR